MVPEPGFEPGPPYGEKILRQLISSIDRNSTHASQHWTTRKYLNQGNFISLLNAVLIVDNVDSCEELSHECPT